MHNMQIPADWRWMAGWLVVSVGISVAFVATAYIASPMLLPGVVVAVIVAAIALACPLWGVCGAMVCVPLELVSLPLPSGALSPSETLLALVAVGYVGRLLFARNEVVSPSARDLPVAGLLAIMLAGIAVAVDPSTATRVVVMWTLFFCVYLQVQSFHREEIRSVVVWSVIGAGILGGIGAVGYLQSSAQQLYSGGLNVGDRAVGTFVDANYYASLLVLVALPGVTLVLVDFRRNGWLLMPIGAATAGVVFSLSRGGIAALSVGLLVLLVWNRARWVMSVILVVLAATVIVGVHPVLGSHQFQVVRTRLGTLSNPTDLEATNGRPAMWRLAVELAGENPWIGIGTQQFQFASARAGVVERGYPVENVHNQLLNFAAENGVIALAAFAAWILQLLLRATVALRSQAPLERALALGLLAALVGFLLQSLTQSQMRVNIVAGSFFLTAGLLTSLADAARRKPAFRS